MMERKIRSVAVYCGSSMGHKPIYRQSAEALGKVLAEQGIQLIYGAGNIGMMKIVANAVLQYGGQVIGVIPKNLADFKIGIIWVLKGWVRLTLGPPMTSVIPHPPT